jgi:hypothetical protein
MNLFLNQATAASEQAIGRALLNRARPTGADTLVRAAVVTLTHAANRDSRLSAVAADLYEDPSVEAVARAAVAPGLTTDAGAALVRASNAVPAFLAALGPLSAAAKLFELGLAVQFGEGTSVIVPGALAAADAARFVGEGQPIPATRAAVSGPTLTASEVAALIILSREMIEAPAVEAITRDFLTRSMALALDASLLGAAAAVPGLSPAGLRNAATTVTATAGGGRDALVADLLKLAEAVSPVAGAEIAIIGSALFPARAQAMDVAVPFPLLGSSAIPPGTLIAVALNAFVVAVDPVPRIEVSTEGVIHEETQPAQIGVAGTDPNPNVVAAPTRSLFQTDCIALRLSLSATWALRAPGSVAVLTGGTW